MDKIVEKYANTKSLSPVLVQFLADSEHKRLFPRVLQSELARIHSRSQNLEDCEITIYDEALSRLADQEDPNKEGFSPGLLELFATEVLRCPLDDFGTGTQKFILSNKVLLANVRRGGKLEIPQVRRSLPN